MKKKKWMLAAVLSAAMVSSSILSVPAEALYQITAEVPNGYEQFEDGGSLDFVSEDGYYSVYRSRSNHNRVLVLTDYRCNIVELEVPTTPENMVSKYEEIKEKYADLVGTFDQYMQNEDTYYGVVRVVMFDTLDEEGNLIKDPSVITSKRGEIQKLCQELQEAGAVTSASYMPYNAVLNLGDYQDFLYLKQVSQAEEDLTTFVQQQFGEDKIVNRINDTNEYYIKGFKNADALFAASTVLEKQFEGARAVPAAIFLANEQTYTTETVNLLTAADACGDIDQDGTVSVEDAVSVLTYYAQQSAGLEAKLTQAAATEESAFLAADVDGDGQITIEDAVAILTYYAKKSAGLDAAW